MPKKIAKSIFCPHLVGKTRNKGAFHNNKPMGIGVGKGVEAAAPPSPNRILLSF